MKNIAVLFTNNLRLKDNSVLQKAIRQWDNIIPLYYFDTKLKDAQELWIKKIGPYRAKFLIESLTNLQENLKNLGSNLHILKAETLTNIRDFAQKNDIHKIVMQEPVGFYEIQEWQELRRLLGEIDVEFETIWDHTMVHLDDLPFPVSELPDMYTEFRKAVEKDSLIREINEKPSNIKTPEINFWDILSLEDFGYTQVSIDNRRAIEHVWWEDAAWQRLRHYFWDTHKLNEYKETRNGLLWQDYSSKFSAWLALWCISPRSIYWEIRKFEKEIIKNSSTYWLIFELLWRDFYQFVSAQNSMRFFTNYPAQNTLLKYKDEKNKFEKWTQGTLWIGFVDANMRELKLTWFMSNRGRQIVASYLINDLKIDWRLWASYFEKMLVDYDVASNWGNWAYLAGVWNDPRWQRYFNIQKQQENYDPKKEYINVWIPR